MAMKITTYSADCSVNCPGLNWGLVGYRRVRERGHFIQPATAREAAEELETLGSPMTAYVRERCRVESGRTVAVELLDSGQPVGAKTTAAKNREPSKHSGAISKRSSQVSGCLRPRDSNSRTRFYEGITLENQA